VAVVSITAATHIVNRLAGSSGRRWCAGDTLYGYGKGDWSNWATGARWYLSDDGSTYDYNISTDSSNSMKQYNVTSGTDTAYNDVRHLWAKDAHSQQVRYVQRRCERLDGGVPSGATCSWRRIR